MSRRSTIAFLCLLSALAGCMTKHASRIRVVDADSGKPIAGATVKVDFDAYFRLGRPEPETTETDTDGVVTPGIIRDYFKIDVSHVDYGSWRFGIDHRAGQWVPILPPSTKPWGLIEVHETEHVTSISIGVFRNGCCDFEIPVSDTFEGFVLVRRLGAEKTPSQWNKPQTAQRPNERVVVVPPFAVVVFTDARGRRMDASPKGRYAFPIFEFTEDELWCVADAKRGDHYREIAHESSRDEKGGISMTYSPARYERIRADLLAGRAGILDSAEIQHPPTPRNEPPFRSIQ